MNSTKHEAASGNGGPDDPEALSVALGLSELAWVNLYIPANDGRQCHFTPMTRDSTDHRQLPVPASHQSYVETLREAIASETERLLQRIRAHRPSATMWDVDPYYTSISNMFLRVTPVQTVDGPEYILRRLTTTVLSESDLQMPEPFLNTINNWLTKPGLTLIGGRYATRKTTHCYSYLKHHLLKYGGVGVIVDAPAEAIFSAEYLPHAHCIQIDLNTHPDPDRKWDQINNVIRKSSATIVYAGEISTPDAARFLMQQAHTGRPILANLHGEDIVNTIENLVDLGEKSGMRDYRSALANALVGVSCQSLVNNTPSMTILQVSDSMALGNTSEEAIRSIILDPSPDESQQQALLAAYESHTQTLLRRAG